jgi:hypothetical protein
VALSHPPGRVLPTWPDPDGNQRGNSDMGREEPLRISCDDCPGGTECRDCLVEFFLGERNARVVRLGGDPAPVAADLDPDLQAAFDTLTAHGLEPQVVAHRRRNGAARAS